MHCMKKYSIFLLLSTYQDDWRVGQVTLDSSGYSGQVPKTYFLESVCFPSRSLAPAALAWCIVWCGTCAKRRFRTTQYIFHAAKPRKTWSISCDKCAKRIYHTIYSNRRRDGKQIYS